MADNADLANEFVDAHLARTSPPRRLRRLTPASRVNATTASPTASGSSTVSAPGAVNLRRDMPVVDQAKQAAADQEQETALATAFYLLDTLAGEGLSQACDDGRTIEADDTVHALCSAFYIEPNIGWYRDLAAELAPPPLPCKSGEGAGAGWIVGSADGKRFRTWMDGWSEWTDVREAATRYARRQDAEAVHMHDEDAWTVVPYTPDATQTREAEGLQEISEDDLREAIQKSIDHPGMTQNLFARKTGISRGHLSEFLSGKRGAEPAIAEPCGYRWALVHDTRATDDLTDAALSARDAA